MRFYLILFSFLPFYLFNFFSVENNAVDKISNQKNYFHYTRYYPLKIHSYLEKDTFFFWEEIPIHVDVINTGKREIPFHDMYTRLTMNPVSGWQMSDQQVWVYDGPDLLEIKGGDTTSWTFYSFGFVKKKNPGKYKMVFQLHLSIDKDKEEFILSDSLPVVILPALDSIHPVNKQVALEIARREAVQQYEYKDLSLYNITAALKDGTWTVEYELKNKKAGKKNAKVWISEETGQVTGFDFSTE